MDYQAENGKFNWSVKGVYDGKIPVRFINELSSDGTLKVEYSLENVSEKFIREAGVYFMLPDQFDSLFWIREGYWSYYPERELSETNSKVALYSINRNRYRQKPVKEWPFDTKSFYYNGTANEDLDLELTNISRSTKENIYQYKLISIDITSIWDIHYGCRKW